MDMEMRMGMEKWKWAPVETWEEYYSISKYR